MRILKIGSAALVLLIRALRDADAPGEQGERLGLKPED